MIFLPRRQNPYTTVDPGLQRATGNDCQVLDIDLPLLLRRVDLDGPLVSNWLHDGVLLSGMALAAAIEMASAQVRATHEPQGSGADGAVHTSKSRRPRKVSSQACANRSFAQG